MILKKVRPKQKVYIIKCVVCKKYKIYLMAVSILLLFYSSSQADIKKDNINNQQEMQSEETLVQELSWINNPIEIRMSYDKNRISYNEGSEKQIAVLATALKKKNLKGSIYRLEVYTDNRGSSVYNQYISQQRADFVKKRLIDYGIPGHHIEAKGRGEDYPAYSNTTPLGRSHNRRLNVVRLKSRTLTPIQTQNTPTDDKIETIHQQKKTSLSSPQQEKQQENDTLSQVKHIPVVKTIPTVKTIRIVKTIPTVKTIPLKPFQTEGTKQIEKKAKDLSPSITPQTTHKPESYTLKQRYLLYNYFFGALALLLVALLIIIYYKKTHTKPTPLKQKKDVQKTPSNTEGTVHTIMNTPIESNSEKTFTSSYDQDIKQFYDIKIGTTFKSSVTYNIVGVLGAGGMGKVFKAQLCTSIGTSETVALKIVNDGSIAYSNSNADFTESLINQLKKETSILSELNGHPNIVGFKGADYINDESGKQIFVVMEYVNGFDLNTFRKHHNLTINNILNGTARLIPNEYIGFILFRIANALDYAHNFQFSDGKNGIIHLDISPGNILINQKLGLIKLSDFGVATSVDEMMSRKNTKNIVGKPVYISPEMLHGHPVDFRSDFYSLGVVLYELLTGVNPNRIPDMANKNIEEILTEMTQLHEISLLPPYKIVRGVNEEISEIIMTMMDNDRDSRHYSAANLRDVAGQAIYNKGFGTTDNSFAYYLAKLKFSKYTHPEKHSPLQKQRNNDLIINDFLNIVNKGMEPVIYYQDARTRLEKGLNPCRIT